MTQQVAVLVDDFRNPRKLPVLDLLTAALQRKGLLALLVNINGQNSHIDAILNADQRQVDAVILLGTSFRDETLNEHSLHPGRPPSMCSRAKARSTRSQRCRVTQRSQWKTSDAICLIAAIGALASCLAQKRFRLRLVGCSTSPRSGRGMALNVPEIAAGAYDRTGAEQAMSRYLSTAANERIDVLMCENDALAFGAMDAARFSFGLNVPTDLGFAGYDGNELAAAPSYDLTTYEQPWAAMVDRLVGVIVGDVEPASVNIPGRLIVRGST
jgi:LacI family transcriptional regulator